MVLCFKLFKLKDNSTFNVTLNVLIYLFTGRHHVRRRDEAEQVTILCFVPGVTGISTVTTSSNEELYKVDYGPTLTLAGVNPSLRTPYFCVSTQVIQS